MINLRKFFSQLSFYLLMAVLVTPWQTIVAQSNQNPNQVQLTTQEFRYIQPDAGEVFFFFFLSNGDTIDDQFLTEDTVYSANGYYWTPMVLTDNGFVAQINIPVGTLLEYGFAITKTQDDFSIYLWENSPIGGDNLSDMHVIMEDDVFEFKSRLSLQPVEYIIEYQNTEAKSVMFGWGVNGWYHAPARLRPEGTLIKGVMQIPMQQVEPNTFRSTIPAVPGLLIEYSFFVEKDDGTTYWDEDGTYQFTADRSGGFFRIRHGEFAQTFLEQHQAETTDEPEEVQLNFARSIAERFPILGKPIGLYLALFVAFLIFKLVDIAYRIVLYQRQKTAAQSLSAPPPDPQPISNKITVSYNQDFSHQVPEGSENGQSSYLLELEQHFELPAGSLYRPMEQLDTEQSHIQTEHDPPKNGKVATEINWKKVEEKRP